MSGNFSIFRFFNGIFVNFIVIIWRLLLKHSGHTWVTQSSLVYNIISWSVSLTNLIFSIIFNPPNLKKTNQNIFLQILSPDWKTFFLSLSLSLSLPYALSLSLPLTHAHPKNWLRKGGALKQIFVDFLHLLIPLVPVSFTFWFAAVNGQKGYLNSFFYLCSLQTSSITREK